jgi:hypothetical protein
VKPLEFGERRFGLVLRCQGLGKQKTDRLVVGGCLEREPQPRDPVDAYPGSFPNRTRR